MPPCGRNGSLVVDYAARPSADSPERSGLPSFGRDGSPVGEVWDACAAHGKVGPVMGLRPLRGPTCIPPEAPPGKVFSFLGLARARGFSCGSFLPSWFLVSPSGAFTQTRLFRPECVSAGILMLTYTSTLLSKSRRFLFRTKNTYFANSPNTNHRLAPLRRVKGRLPHDLLLLTGW